MYGGLGCKLLESGPSFWFVDIQRGGKQAAFETADAELLKVIVPHLARAAELRRQFQSARILESAFSRLPFVRCSGARIRSRENDDSDPSGTRFIFDR